MVTIVKHPDTYLCDVCKTEYVSETIANFCETHFPIKPSSINIGDTVLVETRYDGWYEDTVIDVQIGTNLLSFVQTAELTPDYIRKIFNRTLSHKWVITTSKAWEIGKCDEFTDKWDEREVLPSNILTWEKGFPKDVDPTEILLMESLYGNSGDHTQIFNGSVEWWNKHHSKCELIRWVKKPKIEILL